MKSIRKILKNAPSVLRKTKKIWRKKKRFNIVMIIPYREVDKKILLIREYRKDFDMNIWKLVSGGMDKDGLNALDTAKEEIAEEISMEGVHWYQYHKLGKIFRNFEITYFVVKNPNIMANPPENPDVDDEIIDQRWVNLKEFWNMIDNKDLIWNESTLVVLNFLRSVQ